MCNFGNFPKKMLSLKGLKESDEDIYLIRVLELPLNHKSYQSVFGMNIR